MREELRAAMYGDLLAFLQKAFSFLHPTKKLVVYPYIELVCAMLTDFERSEGARLVFNMPPRSLKTDLCTKVFAAWFLGRNPSLEVMIVTGNEPLANEIAYVIRGLMKTDFYKETFPTRIAKDRSGLLDFATTAGGACFTRPVGAAITGRGADLIVVDDAHNIKDAGNSTQLNYVNEQFDTEISSRLNHPRLSCMLIVGHRVSENDLSGHVLKQGEWSHFALPLVAPRTTTYTFGDIEWRRKKGELLQTDSHTAQQLENFRQNMLNPDFETLYQQNPAGELALALKASHFGSFEGHIVQNLPVVLSVDPGQVASKTSSFSVVQAWCRRGEKHFLIEQWRGQVEYDELFRACRQFRRKYRAAAVLIERSALGAALVSEGNRRKWKRVVPVIPDGRSKTARLRAHVEAIRAGSISLPADAEWRDEFIREFVEFPHSAFADQVDGATQYLDWAGARPELKPLAPRGIIAISRGWRRYR
jgi:predicted phage terminase large subunit-like protein